jgi:hypothetical protein
MMDPRPVLVVLWCPSCAAAERPAQGEAQVAATALAGLESGYLVIPCPMCGGRTRVQRKPERPA